MYIALLAKLDIDQIFTAYKMLYNFICHEWKMEIICNTIKELLKRQMSLKMIVDRLVTFVVPLNNPGQLYNILMCVEPFIKSGEYWDTVRTIVLLLQPPNKNIIEKILRDCIKSDKLSNIQEVNNTLISKLLPIVMSTLDNHLVIRFKNLLTEGAIRNSDPAVSVQEFGENVIVTETIASPDPEQNSSQIESPRRCDITSANTTDTSRTKRVIQEINVMNDTPYKVLPIGNYPYCG